MLRGRVFMLMVGAMFVALTGSAAAATITVNTTVDVTAGGCSLREAIMAVDSPGSTSNSDCAPAAFGASTIVVPPGVYTLGPVVWKPVARVAFSGRIHAHALAPGSYRLELTPKSGRLAGSTITIAFTIRK